MKKFIKFFILLLLANAIILTSCHKVEPAPALDLLAMTAGGVELAGATPATGVSIDVPIKAIFNAPVTEATVTVDNIILTAKGITDSDVALDFTVSGDTIIIVPVSGSLLRGMKYSLALSNLSSGIGDPYELTISFTTEGIGLSTCPQYEKQVLYVPFDNGIEDVTGNATTGYANVADTTDRFGNKNAAIKFAGAETAGEGDIIELEGTNLISPSITISVWIKADLADYPDGGNRPVFGLDVQKGYALELQANLEYIKYFTNHVVNPDPMNHIFAVDWADGTLDQSYIVDDVDYTSNGGKVADLMADKWSQFVLTFDASTSTKRIYINNTKIFEKVTYDDTEWNLVDMAIDTTIDESLRDGDKLALGCFCSRECSIESWANYSSAANTFVGLMDDLRIWNVALAPSEVSTLYNSEKPE